MLIDDCSSLFCWLGFPADAPRYFQNVPDGRVHLPRSKPNQQNAETDHQHADIQRKPADGAGLLGNGGHFGKGGIQPAVKIGPDERYGHRLVVNLRLELP